MTLAKWGRQAVGGLRLPAHKQDADDTKDEAERTDHGDVSGHEAQKRHRVTFTWSLWELNEAHGS